jgi:hypothetical protein
MWSADAQFEEANKEIADLEQRISALKAELQTAQRPAALVAVQRILAIRERQLEHTKRYALFIEDEIARQCREAKPMPCAAPALISLSTAVQQSARDEIGETLSSAKADPDLAKGEELTPNVPRTASHQATPQSERRPPSIKVVGVGRVTPNRAACRMTVVGAGAFFPALGRM